MSSAEIPKGIVDASKSGEAPEGQGGAGSDSGGTSPPAPRASSLGVPRDDQARGMGISSSAGHRSDGTARRSHRASELAKPPEIRDNPDLMKYWAQRYRFFSRFDHGIKLDEGRRGGFHCFYPGQPCDCQSHRQ